MQTHLRQQQMGVSPWNKSHADSQLSSHTYHNTGRGSCCEKALCLLLARAAPERQSEQRFRPYDCLRQASYDYILPTPPYLEHAHLVGPYSAPSNANVADLLLVTITGNSTAPTLLSQQRLLRHPPKRCYR